MQSHDDFGPSRMTVAPESHGIVRRVASESHDRRNGAGEGPSESHLSHTYIGATATCDSPGSDSLPPRWTNAVVLALVAAILDLEQRRGRANVRTPMDEGRSA